jgi:hypothetical protein
MVNIELNSIIIDSNTILGMIAILISIFGLYYTRKQIIMPHLLETQKTHMLDLKNYLIELENILPFHETSYNFIKHWIIDIRFFYSLITRSIWPFWPETESQCRSAIKKLEADWRFGDLIEAHLPDECRDFSEIWENYKKQIYEQEEMLHNLFIKLERDTLNELNELAIDYKYEVNWQDDERSYILVGGIIQSLMLQYLFYYMPKEKQYEGKLAYGKDFVYSTSNKLFVRVYGHPTELAEGPNDDMQKIKSLFERMAFNNSYILNYKNDVIELIEIDASLANNCRDLHKIIIKLQGYPTLPSKKCKILKTVS